MPREAASVCGHVDTVKNHMHLILCLVQPCMYTQLRFTYLCEAMCACIEGAVHLEGHSIAALISVRLQFATQIRMRTAAQNLLVHMIVVTAHVGALHAAALQLT